MMNKRVVSVLLAAVLLLSLVAGCADTGKNPTPGGSNTPAGQNAAQLTIAINPVFVYDDNETVIAYNDIKNAAQADNETASLTSLYGDTAWQWVYNKGDRAQARPIYGLSNWQSGAGIKAKGFLAYAFNETSTSQLSTYRSQASQLKAYSEGDKIPELGLLMSVSGKEEEAICYTLPKDGSVNVAAGFITAIQSVAGVNTGFLAEDGTPRSASLRLMVNSKQLWSGTLCNSTAAADGQAVTSLDYAQISDVQVKAGDKLLLCVRLDAAANADEDVRLDELTEDDFYKMAMSTQTVRKETEGQNVVNSDKSIPIVHDYEPNMAIVCASDGSETVQALAQEILETLVDVTKCDWSLRTESFPELQNEIIVGVMKDRPESQRLMEELRSKRVNHAADYIIRLVGTKVYIVGGSDLALEAAVATFIDKYCRSSKAVIPNDLNIVYYPTFTNMTIADNPIANYCIRTEKYPSLLVKKAAQNLQLNVLNMTGYVLPIQPMTDALEHKPYEIQIGPMQGSLHFYPDNSRHTMDTYEGHFTIDPEGLIAGKGEGYYEVKLSGNHLSINGGSSYAISAAAEKVFAQLYADKKLAKSYTLIGDYASAATPTTDTRQVYSTCDYSLTDGYALVWADEFNYTGSKAQQEADVVKRWSISTDTTLGPTPTYGPDSTSKWDGIIGWDEQRRPGIYGENYWIWRDAANQNGYLFQITKKESYGYDAGRLVADGKWSFRYGIWETRFVAGTRNGACSALWTMSGTPSTGLMNEIDLFENFGEDLFRFAMHSHNSTLSMADGNGHVGHYPASGQGMSDCTWDKYYPAEGEHFYDTFHYLSIEWDADRVTVYCDGEAYDTANLRPSWMRHFRHDTTIKLACGVGTQFYATSNGTGDFDPDFFLEDVTKFFEVQVTDNTRIYQTSNADKKGNRQNMMTFTDAYVAVNQ